MLSLQLYGEMRELLRSFPGLLEDFSAFLSPSQAVECGCFMENLRFRRARTFLRKLEVTFQVLAKICQFSVIHPVNLAQTILMSLLSEERENIMFIFCLCILIVEDLLPIHPYVSTFILVFKSLSGLSCRIQKICPNTFLVVISLSTFLDKICLNTSMDFLLFDITPQKMYSRKNLIIQEVIKKNCRLSL